MSLQQKAGGWYCVTCLGENAEKHIILTFPTEKDITRIDKNGKITKNISYILQFIDSARCIVTAFEYTNFKDDLIEYKCLSCNKSYQRKFHEKLKDFLIDTNFLTLITTLFYYYEKVFILTNNQ